MGKVVHLARKFLPPTASFIYNQIVHHEQFSPSLVYCEETGSVFKDQLNQQIATYKAVNGRSGSYVYRYFRRLIGSDRKKLIRHITKFSPDVLHVHYGVDALVFSKVFEALKIPVLVSFYGYDCTSFPNRFNGLGKLWLQKSLFENPYITNYTAMSPDMKNDLLKLGCPEEKIIVHYHGSDTKPFLIDREYSNNNVIRMLIVGSLTPKKGHFFLLRALKKAQAQTSKQLQLDIVGEGELKESLQHFIKQEQIENVWFHGGVPYGSEKQLGLIKEADVYVHPSITTPQGEKEGIPGALIESRSSGLPAISTAHAGIPFIIEHGKTGLLVRENNVEELAGHILALAENPELREKLGKQGQKFTLETLDVRMKERELEAIYLDMIGRSKGNLWKEKVNLEA